MSHSVTKSCSTGQLSQCGCDRTVSGRSPEGFEWAGCSDNEAFGSAFSRTFVDARERARGDKSSRALMNLHNNEAGRRVSMIDLIDYLTFIINYFDYKVLNPSFSST